MSDNKQLFTGKINEYVKYRPSYPREIINLIIMNCSLSSSSRIADIGSGTGIFSRLLLEASLSVTGIEPNDEMRSASKVLLSHYEHFDCIDGYAENTNLQNKSVDLITAAQAFHWFKGNETKAEFKRILRENGKVALIWNQRDIGEPIQSELNNILDKSVPDHRGHAHHESDVEETLQFFEPAAISSWEVDHFQTLSLDGFIGRIKSASYCPTSNSQEFVSLSEELASLFFKYENRGSIKFPYKTKLYISSMEHDK